jgi:hypothetical protein
MKKLLFLIIHLIILILLSSGIIPIVTECLAKRSSTAEPQDVHGQILSIGRNDNRVMEHLDYLSNSIGPRKNGSESLQEACEWARDQFETYGLTKVHLEKCAEITGDEGCCPQIQVLKSLLVNACCLLDKLIPGVDFQQWKKTEALPLYNVIADIPGSDWSDEFVVVGAHIDTHKDASGISDNGTGVASVMEAARILMESGAKPRRTIRFVLFSGEEIGLHGSRGYVRDHHDQLPKISAMLNMDQGAHYISGIQATEVMLHDFEEIFEPLASLNPQMPFRIEKVDHLPLRMSDCCESGGASDQAAFLVKGVPAFYWEQKGKDRTRHHLHSKRDTLDKIDPDYQKHSSTVIALAALGIADLDHMIAREHIIDEKSLAEAKHSCCGHEFSDPPAKDRNNCCDVHSSCYAK